MSGKRRGGLQNRSCTVELWNPHTGAILSTATVTATGGAVAVPIGSLSDDVALKIR